MDLLKNFRFNSQQGLDQNLLYGSIFLILLVVAVTGGFIYLSYSKRKERFKIFKSHMHGRGFGEYELKRMFEYLYKRDMEPTLILENENIAKEAVRAAGLDEEESLRKLGFDKEDLIKRFLSKQQELRKKWNS